MPTTAAGLHYPSLRVPLPRTRLAYVHLKNLLGDAKRDRSARVSGYVAIWLPEEFLILYLQRGELVNACHDDGHGFQPIAIGAAVDMVPAEPEYGEITFCEAEDEQLACMFHSQTVSPEAWPPELRSSDPAALFPYLISCSFDGMVEIAVEGAVNYLLFHMGQVAGGYLADSGKGTMVERVARLFDRERLALHVQVRRWDPPPPLPVQAPTGLVRAYRDLTTSLVLRLVADGREGAPAIAEHARTMLLGAHPALEGFSFNGRPPKPVVADADSLTAGVAALINELLWTAGDQGNGSGPAEILKELTHERRHLFQSAGLIERMSWKVA
ncbi:MAG TPA: hypothetical protein VKA54_11385 [Gemmatimonadaceae bacterium]|nr:hypothetical protein [Gemmatimonadaceae bacterium]